MGFFGILFSAIGGVIAGWAIICFIIFPLLRYLIFRLIFFFRCLFSRAKFSVYGVFSFIVPHFISNKPDYFLLSGKKLYAIKLKSFRKRKTAITFLNDEKWQIESLRGTAGGMGESAIANITKWVHTLTIHKRTQKAPTDLVRYVRQINKGLANEEIDCVPVVLINPSVKTLVTNDRIDLIDGDTVFYGNIIANGFFPRNVLKPNVSGKDAARIIKIAKKQLKIKLKPLRPTIK